MELSTEMVIDPDSIGRYINLSTYNQSQDTDFIYRITAAVKIETDIITSITPSLIGRAVIHVIMYVDESVLQL